MGLYSGGLIIRRIFASESWGAYFREGLFCFVCFFFFWGGRGLIIGIYGIGEGGRGGRGVIK